MITAKGVSKANKEDGFNILRVTKMKAILDKIEERLTKDSDSIKVIFKKSELNKDLVINYSIKKLYPPEIFSIIDFEIKNELYTYGKLVLSNLEWEHLKREIMFSGYRVENLHIDDLNEDCLVIYG